MDIKKAQQLKIGDIINFPEDRGNSAGFDKITFVSKEINKNIYGVEYIWVGTKKSGVWPSNRI